MANGTPDEAAPGEDEVEVEVEPAPSNYPDCIDDIDEKRRAFILQFVGSPDIDGKIMVSNCEIARIWIETGKAPEDPRTVKIKAVRVA